MNAVITSFSTEAVAYELTIDEQQGIATNCKCPAKHFNPSVPCKHMRQFNAEVQRAAAFLLLQERVKVIEAQTSDVLQTRRIQRDLAFA